MQKNVTLEEIRALALKVLGPIPSLQTGQGDTPLLGAVPELDSIGIMSLLLMVESTFEVSIDDDEVEADIFLNLESLRAFAQKKVEEFSDRRPGAVSE